MRANIISGKKGITIGEKAIVGACTLVNKDIPDGATVVGVPCRKIKWGIQPLKKYEIHHLFRSSESDLCHEVLAA